jgi:hypothetical protein
LGQKLAGSYQKSQGIDITTNREIHNNYQDIVAQNTLDDVSFLSNNYNLDINLNTKNNHNTDYSHVTSTPSVFNSQTVNNNIEFAGLDKELGDNFELPNDINFGVNGLTEWFGLTASGAVKPVNDELNRINEKSVIGPITSGLKKDIPVALQSALDGYRDVRDNSPVVPRTMLKVSITAIEMGLTSSLKGTTGMGYDFFSGMTFDTQPLNMTGMTGQFISDTYKMEISNEK